MSYRLPLIGAARGPDIAAEPLAAEARRRPEAPWLSLVAAMPEAEAALEAQALAFVEAAQALGVAPELRHLRRVTPEAPAPPLSAELAARCQRAGAGSYALVPVEAARAGQALDALADELRAAPLVIALGADVPAFLRPHFALLIDRGASLVGYTAAARAVRGRFDAVLPEARPALAAPVLARLLRARRREP